MKKCVSIIVPIYNGEKYIDRCINSILKQSLKDIEIILIDDGSKDNTKNIISKYAKEDYRVKAIYKNNTGPGNTRNIGIDIANGEYIGFVDADDYIEKDMYFKLYNSAKKNDSDIVICNYRELYSDTKREYLTNHNLEEDSLNKIDIEKKIISTFSYNENKGFYSLWNKIYRKKFILENKLKIDETREHGEDWLFNIISFTKANKCSAIDDILYNYIHINSNSLMYKYRAEQFELLLRGRREIKEILPKELINNIELDKRFMYEFTSYIIGSFNNLDKEKRKDIIFSVLKNDEVKESVKNAREMPIHLKIIMNLIRLKRYKLVYCLYLILWKSIYKNKRDSIKISRDINE